MRIAIIVQKTCMPIPFNVNPVLWDEVEEFFATYAEVTSTIEKE